MIGWQPCKILYNGGNLPLWDQLDMPEQRGVDMPLPSSSQLVFIMVSNRSSCGWDSIRSAYLSACWKALQPSKHGKPESSFCFCFLNIQASVSQTRLALEERNVSQLLKSSIFIFSPFYCSGGAEPLSGAFVEHHLHQKNTF